MDDTVAVIVVIVIVQIARLTAEIVLMKVKDTQQENHQDHAEHHPSHGSFYNACPGNALEAMGQQVEHGDAEDEAGHKTHHDLSARVRHGTQSRQFPADKRSSKDGG